MFEIPLNLVLINPIIDIFIFISIAYFFIFQWYKKLIEININEIFWVDLKFTIILLLLGYINYSGQSFDFNYFKLEWYSYIILTQFIVEAIYALFYSKDVKKYLNLTKVNHLKKLSDKLYKEIIILRELEKVIEDELYLAKKDNDNDKIVKLEKDLQFVKNDINEINDELEKIKEELSNK